MVRQFARLRRGNVPESPDYSVVPSDGMCLNAFLVAHARGAPQRVLLGKIDPAAPWWELSGLGAERIARLRDRWVLPASQLLLLESPETAARRLATELLELDLGPLGAPRVFSETYGRADTEGRDPHWDLHFVYEFEWPDGRPARAAPWKQLALVDVPSTPRADFGRGHADVLELLGIVAA